MKISKYSTISFIVRVSISTYYRYMCSIKVPCAKLCSWLHQWWLYILCNKLNHQYSFCDIFAQLDGNSVAVSLNLIFFTAPPFGNLRRYGCSVPINFNGNTTSNFLGRLWKISAWIFNVQQNVMLKIHHSIVIIVMGKG